MNVNFDGGSSALLAAPQPPSSPPTERSSQLQLLSHTTISRDGAKGTETFPGEDIDISDDSLGSPEQTPAQLDKWETHRQYAKVYMDTARSKAGLPPRDARLDDLDFDHPILNDAIDFDDPILNHRERTAKPRKRSSGAPGVRGIFPKKKLPYQSPLFEQRLIHIVDERGSRDAATSPEALARRSRDTTDEVDFEHPRPSFLDSLPNQFLESPLRSGENIRIHRSSRSRQFSDRKPSSNLPQHGRSPRASVYQHDFAPQEDQVDRVCV